MNLGRIPVLPMREQIPLQVTSRVTVESSPLHPALESFAAYAAGPDRPVCESISAVRPQSRDFSCAWEVGNPDLWLIVIAEPACVQNLTEGYMSNHFCIYLRSIPRLWGRVAFQVSSPPVMRAVGSPDQANHTC